MGPFRSFFLHSGRRQAYVLGAMIAMGFETKRNLYARDWDSNWDKRDPESMVRPLRIKDRNDEAKKQERAELVVKATPTTKRIIILVRHGQYNLDGLDDTQRYLTKLGEDQAHWSGSRIVELLKYYGKKDQNNNPKVLPVNVIMSTMSRALQTGKIIMEHLPETIRISAKTCDLLREGAPIEPIPPMKNWDPLPHVFYEDGMRIEAAFRKYFHRASGEDVHDSVDILVCHGNVIRYFVCRALQLPPEAWLRMNIHNGSITILNIHPDGGVTLSSLGDCGHFTADKMTFS